MSHPGTPQIMKLYHLGHGYRTQPGAKCLIWCDGRLLLVRTHFGSGRWSLPGGGQKPGEPPEVAMDREVWHETGLRLSSIQRLGAYVSEEKRARRMTNIYAAEVDQNCACFRLFKGSAGG